LAVRKTWMAGTSPAMTKEISLDLSIETRMPRASP
jgi:hypothetical protein